MKNALIILALLAAYLVCPAQPAVHCIASACFLADVNNGNDFLQQSYRSDDNHRTEINNLNEQFVSMKSFINANTDFNALKYKVADANDIQVQNKKVLEYFIDAKAKEAYLIIYNDHNQVVYEYPLDLGMKSYLLLNQKKLREGAHTYKLFINGVDVCSRSL